MSREPNPRVNAAVVALQEERQRIRDQIKTGRVHVKELTDTIARLQGHLAAKEDEADHGEE